MQYYPYPITSNTDFDTGSIQYYNYFPIDASGGNITITLPTSVWDGLSYILIRDGNSVLNTVTINAHTGTLNGGSSVTLQIKNYCECVYINGDWKCPKSSYT